MDISLSQYIEIINLAPENFKTITQYHVELVSIGLDQDPEDIKKLKVAELIQHVKTINNLLKESVKPKSEIKFNEHTLNLLPFINLTLGQYIDLENYLKDKKFAHVASVIYNKRLTHQLGFKDQFETYDLIDVEYRAQHINQLPFQNVIGSIHDYIKFRQNLVKSYDNLFVEPETGDDDLSDIERKQIEHQKQVHSQFAWESLILFLANNDVTKWESILNMPILLAFNLASFRKNQLVNENRRQQELTNKYKKY